MLLCESFTQRHVKAGSQRNVMAFCFHHRPQLHKLSALFTPPHPISRSRGQAKRCRGQRGIYPKPQPLNGADAVYPSASSPSRPSTRPTKTIEKPTRRPRRSDTDKQRRAAKGQKILAGRDCCSAIAHVQRRQKFTKGGNPSTHRDSPAICFAKISPTPVLWSERLPPMPLCPAIHNE